MLLFHFLVQVIPSLLIGNKISVVDKAEKIRKALWGLFK